MKIKTAAILALTVSTLFSNVAKAEEANVNFIIEKSIITGSIGTNTPSVAVSSNTVHTDITMTACKKLGGRFVYLGLADKAICASKTGDIEVLKDFESSRPVRDKHWQKFLTQKTPVPK
jgi:hypothetical protein